MKIGSLFSGIGGFDLGFQRAGHTITWECEIDTACQRVLERHFDAPVYFDVRAARADNLPAVDLVCGGFPCQDLSVAGKRAGLAGERSGLWHEFHRVLAELTPRWVCIENVPGLLSSNAGRDMGVVVGGLAELGYGWAYRVLDAQYFGVAQRRRRVFIVGCLGDAARAAAVLFEPESGAGNPPPSRAPREGATAGALGSLTGGQRQDLDGMTYLPEIARAINAERDGYNDGSDQTYLPEVAWALQERDAKGSDSSTKDGHLLPIGTAVRRLTPTECERLQGFPDGWTASQSDSVRYRQLGNAVCVPVAEWIGRRLQ